MSKIIEVYGKVKDFVLKWWFVASGLALAVLVFLLDSKGKKVKQLNDEIQLLRMGNKLQSLKEEADKSESQFQASSKSYDDLKRRHPELFNRIINGSGPDKPAA